MLVEKDFMARGGQGMISRGSWGTHDVALKALDSLNDMASLHHEGSLMYSVHSAYTLTIYGLTNIETSRPLLLMEYMDGGNLRELLTKRRANIQTSFRLNYVEIGLRVALALMDLHDDNIVHRDLKPHNVLLHSTDIVKVADFGIARPVSTQSLTAGVGTPAYMAPEIFDGHYDTKVDIYSLGILLVELETLQVPWEGMSFFGIVDAVRRGDRPSLSLSCPQWYRELALQCMALEPSARPTATFVATILQAHASAP
ncbi:ATP binding protein [Achlya hypogyna]|uniref:ATP binding protein n=1 Tax=Achlya hypogyna TaxID=1202772 RepID=A0A1V9YH48_ACHHY|nr:ATP binding protein [Achlya hypogyna]